MKKLFKILAIILISILVLLIVLPFAFKGKLISLAKTEMNKSLNATVDFGDLKLSFIKGFPDAYIELKDLSVVGKAPFEGDTLVAFHSFSMKVNLISVIKMTDIKVRSIILDHPVVNAIVLKDGKANWDIMVDTTTTPEDTTISKPSNITVILKKFIIKGGNISYRDASIDVETYLQNLDFLLSGDLAEDQTNIHIETNAQLFTVVYAGIKYIKNAALKSNIDLDADLVKYIFKLKENELSVNDLTVGWEGMVAMPGDSIVMDLKFNSKKTTFKSVLSMVPAVYRTDFENIQTSGTLKLDGDVKGVYYNDLMPSVNMALLVQNGMFKYPDLPAAVENVNMDMKLFFDGVVNDNSTVDVDKFHFELARNPVEIVVNVKYPMSDPLVNGMIKGKIDLSNVLKIIPMDSTELEGIITSDVDFMGRMSAIENENYNDFKADGEMSMESVHYKGPDLPQGVTIDKSLLKFSPEYLDLQSFDMVMGKSDFHLNGKILDFLPWFFSDKTVKADFNFSSSVIDANEIMSGFPTDTTSAAVNDTARLTVIEIPKNIHAVLTSSVGKILYDKLEIDDLKGVIEVVDGKAIMKDVAMNMLDGSMLMNAVYNTQDIRNPLFDASMKIKDFTISKAFTSFNTVAKLAPVAENCNGRISASLDISSFLDPHMMPVYSSLTGKGVLNSNEVKLGNTRTFDKMAEVLKTDKFRNMVFKDLNISFEIKNGKVQVKPFENKLANGKVIIGGEHGIDQTLNYALNFAMPRSDMGIANDVAQNLQAAAAAKGLNIQMDELVNLGVSITGTFKDPVIKPAFTKGSGNPIETVKTQLKENAVEKVEEIKQDVKKDLSAEADKILKQANEEAQSIRDAAQKAADEVKAQSNTLADKTIREAEGKPQFAQELAKRSADKIRKEGNAKAKKIVDEANLKAEAVLTEAKSQADKLK